MRRFTFAAVLAGVGLVVFAASADAQVVYGTRPVYAPGTVVSPYGVVTPSFAAPSAVYTSGYYSPYPGALYSPFANSVVPAGYGYYNNGFYPNYGGYDYRSGYYTGRGGYYGYARGYYPRYRRW